MNFKQLCDTVLDLIDDNGYTTEIPVYVNMAYQMAVNEPGVRVPGLKGMSVVKTAVDTNCVSMLTDNPRFSGKLLRVGDPTKITIYPSLETLFDEYQKDGKLLDEEGDVEAVALEDTLLWYQAIPATATELAVIYYSDPPELVLPSDVPTYLPAMLHEDLIAYGAAKRLMNRIEDGVEGPKVATSSFETTYQRGVNSLRSWLAARRTSNNRSAWDV